MALPFIHKATTSGEPATEAHLAGGGECGPSSTWPSKAPSAPPPHRHPHFVRPVSSIFPAAPGVGSQFHPGLAGEQVLWGGVWTTLRPLALPIELPSLQRHWESRSWHRLARGSPRIRLSIAGFCSSSCGSVRPQEARGPARPHQDGKGRGLHAPLTATLMLPAHNPCPACQGHPLLWPAFWFHAYSVATFANILNCGELALRVVKSETQDHLWLRKPATMRLFAS